MYNRSEYVGSLVRNSCQAELHTLSDSEQGTPSVKGQGTVELERNCPAIVSRQEKQNEYRLKIMTQ